MRGDQIKCPIIVCDGENENIFPGQAIQLFRALTCPKDFVMFKVDEGAGSHCQIGALARYEQVIFDKLQAALGLRPGV